MPTAASGTIITDTATVNATNQAFGANSATATDIRCILLTRKPILH